MSEYSVGRNATFPKVCKLCKDKAKRERLDCIRQKWTCSICGKGRRKLAVYRHNGDGMSLGVVCKQCSKIAEASNCDVKILRAIVRRIEDATQGRLT